MVCVTYSSFVGLTTDLLVAILDVGVVRFFAVLQFH